MIDTYRLARIGKRWLLPWLVIRDLERQVADLDEDVDRAEERADRRYWENYRLRRDMERLSGLPPSEHWLDLIGPSEWNGETDRFIEALPVPRKFTAMLNGGRERCIGCVRGVSGGWWVYVDGRHLIESCDLSDLQPLTEAWEPDVPEEVRKACRMWKWWAAPDPFTGEESEGVRLNRETNPNWGHAKVGAEDIPW
jgi:hypothetical protein